MKSLVTISSAIALVVGSIATYFVARPKVNRQDDWHKVSEKAENGWRVATSKLRHAKNAVVQEVRPVNVAEVRSA
jgi:hypothetical protein